MKGEKPILPDAQSSSAGRILDHRDEPRAHL